jgi:hypothetical protein
MMFACVCGDYNAVKAKLYFDINEQPKQDQTETKRAPA